MKPEKRKTPRQELEASLTALLLGELPADKAAALRVLMAKDAELARLYERLDQTIGLVRETAAPAEQGTQSAPLKLSTKRRVQLLAHFKTVSPKEFAKPVRRQMAIRELAIAAGIVVFIGIAAWFTFNSTQQSFSSKSRIGQVDVAESGRETTDMIENDMTEMAKARPQSPVSSIAGQPTARLAAQQALEVAQNQMVAPTLTGSGSSGGSSSPSQTIFYATSGGKPNIGQVALPTLTDYYVRDSSMSTNFIAGDPQWLGIMERGDYSPPAHSSTNPFVSRYASIVVQTNQLDLAGIANLAYAPRVPELVTNRTATNASEFAYYLDLNRNGAFGPQGSSDDLTKLASPSTEGFTSTNAVMAYAKSSDITESLKQLDEQSRRQAGGVAFANPVHSKNGDVGLADSTTEQMSRSEIQEGLRNSSENKPGEASQASEKMPAPVPLVTRAFQLDTNAFVAAIEPFKDSASQMPSTGGGGGGPVTVSGQLPQRTLREPALVPAQLAAPTSPPITDEKSAEVAQEGKDASGSNIYLGKELAKADVKFGTWGLDAGGLPVGTKKEEERLKQVGEVADGVTLGGRATTPGKGFSLLGPKETPPPSGVPVASQSIPLLGDLPVLGNAFKSAETKPGRKDNLSDSESLSVSSTNLQTWAGLLSGVMVTNASGYARPESEWQFTTGTANLGWLGKAETNQLFAGESSNELGATFYVRGQGTYPTWVRNFTVDNDWINPNSLGRTSASQSLAGTSSNVYSLDVAGYSNLGHVNSNLFADRLREAAGGDSYDRNTHYRQVEQLGAEGDKETKLALSYSDVQDDDRKAAGKSSTAETKETNVSVQSELVSEVIPIKYAKASEIAGALNSLGSGGGGGATVGGGTTRSLSGMRGTGGFGRTGTGANYASPSGTQPPAMTTPQANVNPATSNSFTDRLRGIINRAANAGEIVVFGQTKMIADERANSLLLYASRDDMKTIKDIIAKLDVDLAQVKDPKVVAKPVTPPLIPQPEVQTRENAFSTFSLNVSDVAFKLAAASLEKGQMPEPAGIRSEEFINAFDYRDPEAAAGVPVAFAWERARYPYAQNRDLLRFSIKTAAQGRQAGRPLNIVLLLDNSGSMERADRVAIIREALKVLASQLQPQDKLSVITFARTAQLRVDGVAGTQAAQVAEDIGGLTPEGGTNIEEAMNLAYQTALRHYLANGINRVVLLTDGAANLGNVEPDSLKQKVEANRKQGIALDCFGIGWEGFNDDLLETLSRNGDGRYGFINSPEEAASEFAGQLAGALNVAASDVKVQVEFNPARVTAYRQIGYAKHQLTKEQFRDNTVDAAEIAAQEAGNALYVIEVNPAGQGPLGTVRVRFKIPGTSDYREHEWSVPFNGNAVALEQASPAMRLAATAGAFSEWLATSPYATEVTPDTLLSYLSGVPEVYGMDARPKKLEWMIRQAKSIAGREIRNSNVETRNNGEIRNAESEARSKSEEKRQFP